MSSKDVMESVEKGAFDFYDHITKRKVTLEAFSFHDGCTGYGHVWDAKGEDHEYVGMFDLSMLSPLSAAPKTEGE